MSAWLRSGEQFHVLRDGPFHRSQVLAGLWGANNYINMTRAASVRNRVETFRSSRNLMLLVPALLCHTDTAQGNKSLRKGVI